MRKTIQVQRMQQNTVVFSWISNHPYSVTLAVNQKFKLIRDVGKSLNIIIPPRKCFGYFDGTLYGKRVAVWCLSIDRNRNSAWDNRFSNNNDILTEQLINKESSVAFQKRIKRSGGSDEVDLLRMVYAKINGVYVFKGFYRLSAIDFYNNSVTFKREAVLSQLKIQKVTISVVTTTAIQTSVTVVEKVYRSNGEKVQKFK